MRHWSVVASMIVASMGIGRARADHYTATEIAYTASGAVGSRAFTNARVSVGISIDGPGPAYAAGVYSTSGTATILISGTSLYTIVDPVQFFVDTNAGTSGIRDLSNGDVILGNSAPGLSTYNPRARYSDTLGSALFTPGATFATVGSAGGLRIDSITDQVDLSTTFVASVPAPPGAVLLGLGLSAAVVGARRSIGGARAASGGPRIGGEPTVAR